MTEKDGKILLGRIIGKTTTNEFEFLIEGDAKKFDYVETWHKEYGFVLSQIIEIVTDSEKSIAKCVVLGYKKKIIRQIKTPLTPNTEVLKANDKDISDFIKLPEDGIYIGLLRDKSVKIRLDVEKLLTKHLAILAKTGAGKSYTVGVILEELIEKGIPLVIIDPHGEYNSLKEPNSNKEEIENMTRFGIKPTSYESRIFEYGNQNLLNVKPLQLDEKMSEREMIEILPKLSNTQLALLYSAMKDCEEVSISNVIYALQQQDSNAKWVIISMLQQINESNIFSSYHTPYNELVQPNRVSIINLKGYSIEEQEIIAFKLMNDLFKLRKLNKVPPFFLVVEEAHNFCPERNFGQTKSSKIMRTIASEGRKFGLGLAIISQRPSRVDKNVLSQCNTQIIMKVTNPNDLKAIMQSVEGIYAEAEDEIKNLPIGNALISGVVDVPLIVEIRPRKTRHGGETQKILKKQEPEFLGSLNEFKKKEILPVIQPNITEKDFIIMSKGKIKKVKRILVPSYIFECENPNKYNILIEMEKGGVITNINTFETKRLPELKKLNYKELKILEQAYLLSSFTIEEIIHKTGIIDAIKEIKSLIKKSYLQYDTKSRKYRINKNIILSDLSNFDTLKEAEFIEIRYDEKREERMNIDKIKEELSQFTKVINQKKVFVLRYSGIIQK